MTLEEYVEKAQRTRIGQDGSTSTRPVETTNKQYSKYDPIEHSNIDLDEFMKAALSEVPLIEGYDIGLPGEENGERCE